jgi:hypothetical protein
VVEGDYSKGDRWKVLTEPNRDKQAERDRAKMAKELEEIQKYCPFRPQIAKRNASRS